MGVVLSLHRIAPVDLAKLERRREWDEDEVGEELERWEESPDDGDLDKAWHGIHYLLTGTADGGEEPECLLLKGGRSLPAFDLGAGPARILSPDQVSRFAASLAGHTHESLRARYDPKRMVELEVYFAETLDEEGEEGFGYLLDNLDTLMRVVEGASAAGEGLVIYFS